MDKSRQPSMARLHSGAAIVLLAFSAFLAWEASKLQFYTPVGPGAGFFPMWLSGILALLSLFVLAQSFIGGAPVLEPDFKPTAAGAQRIGAVLLGLVFFVLVLDLLGFRITIFILSLALIHIFGRISLLVSVPVSLGLSFGVFYVFSDILKITLPLGPLGL